MPSGEIRLHEGTERAVSRCASIGRDSIRSNKASLASDALPLSPAAKAKFSNLLPNVARNVCRKSNCIADQR